MGSLCSEVAIQRGQRLNSVEVSSATLEGGRPSASSASMLITALLLGGLATRHLWYMAMKRSSLCIFMFSSRLLCNLKIRPLNLRFGTLFWAQHSPHQAVFPPPFFLESIYRAQLEPWGAKKCFPYPCWDWISILQRPVMPLFHSGKPPGHWEKVKRHP